MMITMSPTCSYRCSSLKQFQCCFLLLLANLDVKRFGQYCVHFITGNIIKWKLLWLSENNYYFVVLPQRLIKYEAAVSCIFIVSSALRLHFSLMLAINYNWIILRWSVIEIIECDSYYVLYISLKCDVV